MDMIPENVRSFFWDYDSDTLSLEQDRDLIIGRLLSSGNWKSIQWLYSELGEDELRTWVMHTNGRGLSPPRLRFLEILLNIPHAQVNHWLSEKGRKIWDERALP